MTITKDRVEELREAIEKFFPEAGYQETHNGKVLIDWPHPKADLLAILDDYAPRVSVGQKDIEGWANELRGMMLTEDIKATLGTMLRSIGVSVESGEEGK